ncbi:hypothetical protein [uncultured Faecalicoccus sp.]|uniref:hypothetical protein n=1 Tax=uncultured Faecalicoccus sp. TaxID=1971760 RepID=UPI0025DDE37C|nr:hypothetical protein [uncultured Faecalicoccus sp.]
MAGKKISQLDKLTELTGTEIIPVAKDGQNYGVETLALLGISVYDIPEPLDDNYIYTPEQLAEIKKSIEDGKIIRFGGWSMPTVYFLEDDGEMVFDIDNGDWSRVIFTIKANGEWEINPPVDFFNYVVEMPNIVEGEELTGTLPAETFGDLLERLKRSGNVMFRYPQAGSSNPVNQYDIGISFRYYQTNVTIIHAEGTREFSIIPSGNYTDRPVVSKQYQLITTRLNDYITDVSNLFGKLAVRSDVGVDEKNVSQKEGYYNGSGVLQVQSSGFVYQKIDVSPSKVYQITQNTGNYPTVSSLVLFDENNEVIHTVPYTLKNSRPRYFIFAGVASVGISFIKSVINSQLLISYDIQDLTTVLNTQQGNRALYVAAGAVYNQNTGFYELNELTDITEEQMKVIYVQTHVMDELQSFRGVFAGTKFRTNLGFNRSLMQTNGRQFQFYDSFRENKSLEVLRISYKDIDVSRSMIVEHLGYAFYSCVKLRKIIGIIRLDKSSGVTSAFDYCLELQDVKLYGLLTNISFAYSPLISIESLQYLITNAANTSPITVTVHADVYTKIQDEGQVDWHALIETAAAKQITFATA